MLSEEELQAQKEKIAKATKKQAKEKENNSELARAKAKIKELEQALEDEEDKTAELREQQNRYMQNKNALEEDKAVTALINDDNNKLFVKRYHYDIDGAPLDFSVKLYAPTLSDLGAIEQVFVDLTKGRGYDYGNTMQLVFQALSAFQVMGSSEHNGEVPEFLKDPQHMYRWDILVEVYSDYLDWINTFQETQRH